MSPDLIIGWFLGLISSLLTGVVMFWLEGRREERTEHLKQKIEDVRAARNWANQGKVLSLRGFDLSGAELSGKDLSNADLEDANLEGATLWATNFSHANLRRANLRKTAMKGTQFRQAVLHLVDFTEATMIKVNFSGADLRKAKMQGIKKLENCIWSDVIIDETTELSPFLKQQIDAQSQPIIKPVDTGQTH